MRGLAGSGRARQQVTIEPMNMLTIWLAERRRGLMGLID